MKKKKSTQEALLLVDLDFIDEMEEKNEVNML